MTLSDLTPGPLCGMGLRPIVLPTISGSGVPEPMPVSRYTLPSGSGFKISPRYLVSALSSSMIPYKASK